MVMEDRLSEFLFENESVSLNELIDILRDKILLKKAEGKNQ